MSPEESKLNEIEKSSPFKVPEGYFEQFSEEMMSRLPEHKTEKIQVINLWDRFRPWVYMAAMLAGVAFMIKNFVMKNPETKDYQSQAKSGIVLHSDAEIEDFYRYYEDQVAEDLYHRTAYLEHPN